MSRMESCGLTVQGKLRPSRCGTTITGCLIPLAPQAGKDSVTVHSSISDYRFSSSYPGGGWREGWSRLAGSQGPPAPRWGYWAGKAEKADGNCMKKGLRPAEAASLSGIHPLAAASSL